MKANLHVGIFGGISNAEYHSGPGISKSGLDLIAQSPLHYIINRDHRKPPTTAMIFGSALHKLVLEPDTFLNEYVEEPCEVVNGTRIYAPRRPSKTQINAKKKSNATLDAIAFWEDWDYENEGRTMITSKPGKDPFWQPGDWDRLHHMRDAVIAHPIASVLLDLSQGRAEQSVFWFDKETGKYCKCRPDFLNDAHSLCVDLKSTEDASFTGFSKYMANYRYHVQAPFYTDGLEAVGEKVRVFVFVAIEKHPPYAIGVYKANDEAMRIGRIMYKRDLAVYAECMKNGKWPSYPEEIRDIEVSQWGLEGNIS